MKKFMYTAGAFALLFFANLATSQAQSALPFALSAAVQLDIPVALTGFEPVVYTSCPAQIIEFSDDECLLVVYDMDGKKVYNTIVMDGKMTVPSEMVGMVHLLDINSQSGHQSFEISVREAADYAENY